MPSREYSSWRAQKLTDPERAAKYMTTALEESPEDFLYALKNVIQANQVSTVAKLAGVQRESLYRSFSKTGNPTWTTMQSVLRAIGVEFPRVQAINHHVPSPTPETPASAGTRTRKRRARRKISGTGYQQLSLEFTQTVPIPQGGSASKVLDRAVNRSNRNIQYGQRIKAPNQINRTT